ncbi:MAG: hypothetical protein NZ750_12210 [Anaerolineae bacterium]|nr:hypothetical protein [Anaerolineae bacterium]MDW8172121.1 hypothetical protein [Anaerolineae bacterium]
MEYTEIRFLTRLLRRRWWLILLPALIVGALVAPQLLSRSSGGSSYSVSFRYSAAQSSSNLPQRDGDFQDVWLASEFTVNAFTEWIKSSSFRAELAAKLGDEVSLEGLGIATDRARSVGLVQMTHPNAQALEKIVAVAIDVLRTRNAAYFPHLGEQNAEVRLLDEPQVTPAPPPLANRFGPLLQIGAALLLGLVIAFLAEVFDPLLHQRDELERLGWRVLAIIPKE